MKPKCNFTKADGSSCGATAKPNGWCWFHDPAIAEQRKQANKRGGRQPKKRLIIPSEAADLPLENMEDVQHALADTVNKVRKGELSTPVGHCLSQLFGQLVRVFRGEPEMTLNVRPSAPTKTMIGPEVLQQLLADVKREKAATINHPPQIGLRDLSPVEANGENFDHAV